MASKIVVHLRGLPWDATDASIGEFLEITPEQVSAIKICTNEAGKPSGEGYVVVTDAETLETCMTKHKQTMAGTNRYIEIFKSSEQAMEAGAGVGGKGQWDGVVKVTSVPAAATEEQIAAVFGQLEWMDGGITVPRNDKQECIGEAYVQFLDYTNANQALNVEGEIEGESVTISKSNNAEVRVGLINALKAQFGIANQKPVVDNTNFGQFQGGTWGGLNIGGAVQRQGQGRGGGRPAPY